MPAERSKTRRLAHDTLASNAHARCLAHHATHNKASAEAETPSPRRGFVRVARCFSAVKLCGFVTSHLYFARPM